MLALPGELLLKSGTIKQVSPDYPCGFCGQTTIGKVCGIIQATKGKIDSKCPFEHPLRMKDASKSSGSRHSSNVPVKCKLANCSEWHWKYNMLRHFSDKHPSWEDLLRGNNDFLKAIEIEDVEKERIGVPLELARPSPARLGHAPRREREAPITRHTHN